MPVKVHELIARLEVDGWYQVRQKGSHRQFHHRDEARHCDSSREGQRGSATGNAEQRVEAGRLEVARRSMEYLVVIERGPSSFGAYVPDLPGCVAVGETRQEVEALIREAIEFHIEGLREEGQPLPEPSSTSQLVSIDA
jgi:predicted RNase H-like HicB family nuclease